MESGENESRDAFIAWAVPWLHKATMNEALDLYEEILNVPIPDPMVMRELARRDRFFLLTHILRRVDMIHPWLYDRIREVEAEPDGYLDLWAREHGKALALDTPVPTPIGWRCHGDLRAGDEVYGPSGVSRRVVATTEVSPDEECFAVTVGDAEPIVCSREHLWRIRRGEEESIVTARELSEMTDVTIDSMTRPRPVRSVVRVPSVPTSCIQIDHPDGMYTVGTGWICTHNSSTITFGGTIQEILNDPEITIGIFSHTAPTARKFLAQIKSELEQNALLQSLFPDILYPDPRKQTLRWSIEKGIVVKRRSNQKESTVEAHGLVDGQPTGSHFRLRIYDDVVTLDSVGTPEQIEKTTTAWSLSQNLSARDEEGTSRAWHIGTRYHYADTYHEMIEMGAVKTRVYPATDNGMLDGKPVFLSEKAWAEKLRTQTRPVLAAQMLLNPSAGTEAMFDRDWLKFSDIRPGTLNVYILADPASSRKKGTDFTAMVVIGVDSAFNLYLLDGHRDKMTLAERWKNLRDLRRHWMRQAGVQSVHVGYERYGMQSDIEHFELEMERDRDAFDIVELAWPREGPHAKNDRIQRLEPYFRAGRFYMAAITKGETSNQKRVRDAGQAWRIWAPTRRRGYDGNIYSLNKEFITEYLAMPFSVHDDLLDAASRIFDIDPAAPVIVDQTRLVPDYVD